MDYKEILERARMNGTMTEAKLMQSACEAGELLEMAVSGKLTETDMKRFKRRQHEIFNGPHYNEELAREDVASITYTGKSNDRRSGEYWTKSQIEEATRGMTFPNGTTEWDKYVAFNSFYSDLCLVFSTEEIIKAAYHFFFQDEDAGAGKVWNYMQAVRK